MKKFVEISLAILSLRLVGNVVALRCYSCSITSGSSDMKCISDPISMEGQSIINCNRKYCTILRQELKDPPGKINTFTRGCEERPVFLNDVIDDPTFKSFYRSCSSDLCNDGDGKKSSTQPNISSDGFDDSKNIVVPGLPFSASIKISSSSLWVVISFSICVIIK